MAYNTYEEAQTRYNNTIPIKVISYYGRDYDYVDVFDESSESLVESALNDAMEFIEAYDYVGQGEMGGNKFPLSHQEDVPEEVKVCEFKIALRLLRRYHIKTQGDASIEMYKQHNIDSAASDISNYGETYTMSPDFDELDIHTLVKQYLGRWMLNSVPIRVGLPQQYATRITWRIHEAATTSPHYTVWGNM